MLDSPAQSTLIFCLISAGKPDGLENPRVVEEPRVYPYGFHTRPAPGTVLAGTGAGWPCGTRGCTRDQPYS
jgi:hypothetical protein